MFIEPKKVVGSSTDSESAWIEVICGCMFSGKTEELIRRMNRARIARQKVCLFKPRLDVRYKPEMVVSHNRNEAESVTVSNSSQIPEYAYGCDVIGIDEAQFFDDGITGICAELANAGIRVIIAGLDKDFKGLPFGPMPQLMSIAEYITKLHAICMGCGETASFSFRISHQEELVVLGEKDLYQALCRSCYLKKQASVPVSC